MSELKPSNSYMDEYCIVVIRNEHDDEVLIIESEFNYYWRVVGWHKGTQKFVKRIYFEDMLDGTKDECKHRYNVGTQIETFGNERNIHKCPICGKITREPRGAIYA